MSQSQQQFSIDMPVRVYADTDAEKHGVVVDDFGETTGESVKIAGRIVRPARRWAVTLDTGELVFVDSEQLAAE